ncbi:hypothetical protein [Leeia oryzae]|uniref:hypothetical protein n=1 Tax=Leeia oryzae TaxID=356662 RepID=UPI0003791BCA|nr:hypothetical protein [Leeia oryzae]
MWDKLKRFISGTETMPLSSASAAKQWFTGLGDLDPSGRITAYLQLCKTLEAESEDPTSQVAALLWLEDRLYDSWAFLQEHYAQNPKMPKVMEEACWQLIINYANQQIRHWLREIKSEHFQQLNVSQQTRIQALVLRYINVIAKFHYFRFKAVPEHLWPMAHQLIRAAEAAEAEAQPLVLHPEAQTSEGATSCTDEYLTLILLNTLSASGLTIRQIDMADQWLHVWSRGVALDRRFQPQKHHFGIDLAQADGPTRIHAGIESPSARYIDCNDLVVQIDKAIQAIRAGGSEIDNLGLPDSIRHPGASELLSFLHAQWSNTDRAKKRHSPRVMVNKLLDVALGFHHVASLIQADNISRNGDSIKMGVDYDEMIDMRLYGFVSQRTKAKQAATAKAVAAEAREKVPYETWLIQDESEGGFGAVLPYTHAADDLKLGQILAVRLAEEENWHVATLRRVSLQDNKHYFAGIQLLGVDPVIALYHDEHTKSIGYVATSAKGPGGVDLPPHKLAIFIELSFEKEHNRSLLLRAEDFANGKVMELHIEGKPRSLELLRVIEKGVDWVWAEVRPVYVVEESIVM